MDFTGKLGKYKVIETEDKTKTLWSEYFNEACHNLSGAYEETLHNYILGCEIAEQIALSSAVHVLDVGFGLGIGLKAFIGELTKSNSHDLASKLFTYTSIELDEDLLLWSCKETFPDLIFHKNELNGITFYNCSKKYPHFSISIQILLGDGRKTLPEFFNQSSLPLFTAIFQDAFSPKKNPTLWTVEWFDDLKKMSSPEVYLATYSSSVSIRKSMIAAGWKIKNAKGFGQKKTMTKGRLQGQIENELLLELGRSPTLELRDN